MAGEKLKPRFVSKETTGDTKILGLMGGVIGLWLGIAAVTGLALTAVGGALVYDKYRNRKERKHGGGAH